MTVAEMMFSSPAPSCLIDEAPPVFAGLARSMVSGKEIAKAAGVTPPTVSKWRKGRAKPPEAKLAFLTLFLAHWLDELGNERYGASPRIEDARQCLKRQEIHNASLPPKAIHEGARLFKRWWNGKIGLFHLECKAAPADLHRAA